MMIISIMVMMWLMMLISVLMGIIIVIVVVMVMKTVSLNLRNCGGFSKNHFDWTGIISSAM